MSGRYLLDTNIVIALLRNTRKTDSLRRGIASLFLAVWRRASAAFALLNGERSVKSAIAVAEEVFLSAIVVGELYFGAAKSGRPEANRAIINEFVQERVVLPCDVPVGREYGRLKGLLKTQVATTTFEHSKS